MLVQGASGGVATACIAMARAAGFRVYATARTEDKQARALELGAHAAFASGARLPEKVDAVMETVGEATYAHSARVAQAGRADRHLRRDVRAEPAGRPQPVLLPAAGARRLDDGHQGRAAELISFLDATGLRPHIDRTLAAGAGRRRASPPWPSGDLVGKIVLEL